MTPEKIAELRALTSPPSFWVWLPRQDLIDPLDYVERNAGSAQGCPGRTLNPEPLVDFGDGRKLLDE
jgi:hypothetical protein